MQLFVAAVRKFSISETFRFLHQRILCPGLYKLSPILCPGLYKLSPILCPGLYKLSPILCPGLYKLSPILCPGLYKLSPILCPGLYKLSPILMFVVAETEVLYYWKPVTRAYAYPSLEF